MKINKVVFCIFLGSLLWFIYFFNLYDFLIGYDSNTYVIEALNYINNKDTKIAQNFLQETGLYLYILELNKISGISQPISLYKILILVITLVQSCIIFLILSNVWGKFKIFWASIFILSIVSINHLYLFIFRQYFSASFLLIWILILDKKINFQKKSYIIGYMLWVLLFFHKWSASIYLIILLSFLVTKIIQEKEKMYIFLWIIKIIIISSLIYTPYLIEYKDIFMKTFKDVFVISTNTAQWVYAKGQGTSLIRGGNTPFKETIIEKIFFNPFFGIIWIILISEIKKIFFWNKIKKHWLLALIIYIYLIVIEANFSQRTMYIVFLIICLVLKEINSLKRRNVLILILFSILVTGTITVAWKKPNLNYKDSLVSEFLMKIPKENSIIVSSGGNNNIPGQLWYLFWEYMHSFSDEVQKDKNVLTSTFEKDLLTLGHEKNIKIPDFIKEKNIYIVIWSWADGRRYNSLQAVESIKWDKSPYAEKIISWTIGIMHPLKHVYLYKTKVIKEFSNE